MRTSTTANLDYARRKAQAISLETFRRMRAENYKLRRAFLKPPSPAPAAIPKTGMTLGAFVKATPPVPSG